MKTFKNKFKTPFKDQWNNLVRQGCHEKAYALFLEHFPKFKHVESKQRVKFYRAALEELGLISK